MAAVKLKTKSNVKLKAGKKKSINKWFIIVGVVAVAVVGVVIVRFSGASGFAFTRINTSKTSSMYMRDLSTGKKIVPYLWPYYGTIYAGIAKNPLELGTVVSGSELSRSLQVCAHYRFQKKPLSGQHIYLAQRTGNGYNLIRDVVAKQSGDVCSHTKGFLARDGALVVFTGQGGGYEPGISISKFYGTK